MEEFTIPKYLLNIPQPPKKLYIRGNFPETKKYLCVIGSRKHTDYGARACRQLIKEIRGYSICIVSGLALGMDTIAHVAALENDLPTIAFPGSGLNDEVIAPSSHLQIAHQIIEKGGCLLSEHEPLFPAQSWTFPERNRLMAGISDAVLVIEAQQKSGTLITARMAVDYNKTVLAVPGSIFSAHSEGSNFLIRSGATPIRNGEEIIDALGLKTKNKKDKKNFEETIERLKEICSASELAIISNLQEPRSREDLVQLSGMHIQELNVSLSMLELKEIIEEKFSVFYLKIF